MAARIGASLSTADNAAGDFSAAIWGDSALTIGPVCMVRGPGCAEFDVVGLECASWPFRVDDDGRVAGGTGGFGVDIGKIFDNELLVVRPDFCEGFALRLVLGFGIVADFFVLFGC